MSLKLGKVIFIFPYAPTAWDASKFGFDYFCKQKIDLEVLDLSSLYSTRCESKTIALNEPFIKKIRTYDEFKKLVKAVTTEAIFIDGINAMGGLKWGSRRIFRILKQYHVNYCIVELGALPLFSSMSHGTQFYSKIKKAITSHRLVVAYIKWKLGSWLIHWQWKYLKQYSLPIKIFSGHSESLDRYLKKYCLTSSRVIPIHSYDYDRYLNYLRLPPNPIFPDQAIAVFLDQMLPFHSDFGKNVSFKPVTAEQYYPSLNRFFEKMERQFNLKVVIAASPRSDLTHCQILFDHRPVLINRTVELVAESKLVLMHTSTAVSFAVLFMKTIFMLKTDEMTYAAGYAKLLDNMAKSLGINPICIDDHDIKINSLDHYPRNYDNYKYKYIMTKNLENKLTWEIIMKHLHAE